ncbi:MAG: conjugal transfer protein TraJ [Nitrosomonas sp.]|nr:conjugal transfer protein TraJ [Nitrosomonas sp.]
MMSEPKTPKKKRKHKLHLRVPVEPEEGKVIKEQAEKCGLSISEYLRRLGLGFEPTSIIDNQKVNELAKINGDLGRLGGLLKLWLSDDRRAAHFDKKEINNLLKELEQTRTQMTDIMMKVIKSKK